jgi:methylated-DNA-[protein]-cysteine S-methyltransferase
MTHYAYIDSGLGRVLLTSDGRALTGVYFEGQKYQAVPRAEWSQDSAHPVLIEAREQLAEYFAGRRLLFDLPLAAAGTPFQMRVWRALSAIPCGTTVSYGALAGSIDALRGVRAVAAAVGRNPISVVIPCHRVIGSDGSLTGYAGGLERKRSLLELEAAAYSARKHENLDAKTQRREERQKELFR